MKKLLILVAVLVLVMALFVACGGDDTTTTKPGTTTTEPETTTTKPETTTTKPETTTSKPETTTSKPETTTSKPETTTQKPTTDSTEKPVTAAIDMAPVIANLAFENHHADLNNNYTVAFYFSNSTTDKIFEELVNYTGPNYSDATINNNYTWKITIGDGTKTTTYTIERFSFYCFDADDGFIRCDLGPDFALTLGNITYAITITITDESGTAFYAELSLKKALLSGLNVELPVSGLAAVEVNKESLSYEGITPWNAETEGVKQLFDGNTVQSKLGGTTNGTVTVNFSLTAAATLSYYTLYTGNDTSGSPERNPDGFVLYGKVGEDWVELSKIESGETHGPGLEAKDATPYSYEITNKQSCSEYKIVFTTNSTFQMNELVLYAAAN